MFVLGIESTCDETACAIVRNGKEVLANVISSQCDLHKPFGGVFPELACRKHVDALIPVIKNALEEARLSPDQIDLISAAKGPGLIGALLIGLNAAKALAYAWNIPFIGVNHVEAHLYAAMMPLEHPPLPAIGLVVSGGHTFLVRMEEIGQYQLIGSTQDDAIGEAFDKVAAMLGLPYPGGPAIEALAKQGDPKRFAFRPGKIKDHPWDFSFSGLKTNVLYTIKGPNSDKHSPLIITEDEKADVAASFQETALKDVVMKAIDAAKAFACKVIYCGGGVSNNQRLRALFSELNCPFPIYTERDSKIGFELTRKLPRFHDRKSPNIRNMGRLTIVEPRGFGAAEIPIFESRSVYYPPKGLSLDNAAMIAGLGYHCFLCNEQKGDPLDLEPLTRIPLGAESHA